MPGALTARFAVLVAEFGVKPWEFDLLTPRQIQDIYFHPRDKDGAIKGPDGVATGAAVDPAARLAQLLALAPSLKLPAGQVEELKRRLEALTHGDAPGPG